MNYLNKNVNCFYDEEGKTCDDFETYQTIMQHFDNIYKDKKNHIFHKNK